MAELSELSDLDRSDPGARPGDDPGAPEDPAARTTEGSPRSGRDVLRSVPVAPWVRPTGPRDWPDDARGRGPRGGREPLRAPDPPLVLGRDPLLTMAWALVVGVPILLLVVLVVARPYP